MGVWHIQGSLCTALMHNEFFQLKLWCREDEGTEYLKQATAIWWIEDLKIHLDCTVFETILKKQSSDLFPYVLS